MLWPCAELSELVLKTLKHKSVSVTANIKSDVFPPTDAFLRLHKPYRAGRCVTLHGRNPCFPAANANGPCAASFNIMHHLEEKLRRLELQVFVGTSFIIGLAAPNSIALA